MERKKDFLAPRLEGKRFEDHTLPVSLLEDFTALEELIFEVAKQIFLEENPQRMRVPKGFTDNVSLKLVGLESGSTIPKFILVSSVIASTLLPDTDSMTYTTYMEKARDRVIQVIKNAKQGNSNAALASQKYLNFFNRIGKNLLNDESIDFAPETSGEAILDKIVRKKILLSREEKFEYSESISVNASIPAVDKKAGEFTLDVEGNQLTCVITNDFYDTIISGFGEYEKNTLVAIKATGIFNEQDKLIRVEAIESMDILDPFDVNVRLNQLSKLKNNWYEGFGKAPSVLFLEQFGEYFSLYYNRSLPLPSIFPTIEGSIQLEWEFSTAGLILEVNQQDFTADLLVSNNDDTFEERMLDLKTESGWEILNIKIETLI